MWAHGVCREPKQGFFGILGLSELELQLELALDFNFGLLQHASVRVFLVLKLVSLHSSPLKRVACPQAWSRENIEVAKSC